MESRSAALQYGYHSVEWMHINRTVSTSCNCGCSKCALMQHINRTKEMARRSLVMYSCARLSDLADYRHATVHHLSHLSHRLCLIREVRFAAPSED